MRFGGVALSLECLNHPPKFSLSSFTHSFDQCFAGLKHRYRVFVVDNFSSFMKSMPFQRSGGFNNTVYRNVHGTVFIEVSHLENRVAKTMVHLVNF